MVSLRSKKQTVVARFSAEAEYRAMAYTTCELLWFKQFLDELIFPSSEALIMFYDNRVAINITSNPFFYVYKDRVFVIFFDIMYTKNIVTMYLKSNDQLADMIMKVISRAQLDVFNKLGLIYIFALA